MASNCGMRTCRNEPLPPHLPVIASLSRASSRRVWAGLIVLIMTISVFALAGCDFSREQFSQSTPTSIPPTSTLPPTIETETPPAGGSTATTGPGATAGSTATGRVLPVSIAEVASDRPEYDRGTWRHWTDEDSDCQNARQEVLIAESSVAVTFQSDEQCRVATGLWLGPYTGTEVDDPGSLDVDHMVPLENAHRSGGWNWSPERKREFANYLGYENHLIATTARANRSKGSKGPEEWRPPLEDYWCQYAVDWVTIKNKWGLTVTEAEYVSLSEMLATCEITVLLQPTQGTPPSPPTPTIPPSLPADLRYDPFGPDRNCGDFDTYQEALAFFLASGGPEDDRHRLDVNGDGAPCETLPGGPAAAVQHDGLAAASASSKSASAGDDPGCPATGPPQTAPPMGVSSDTACDPTPVPAAAILAPPLHASPQTPSVSPLAPSPMASPTPPPTLTAIAPEPHKESRPPVPASQADPQPSPTPEPVTALPVFLDLPFDPDGPDRNCDEFDEWWDAQNFYLASGGPAADPHRLDQNGDGTACDSLLGSAVEGSEPIAGSAVPPTGADDFQDRNCSDFETWEAAQNFFTSEGGPSLDPHRLDGDGDGTACQSLPGAPKAASPGDLRDSQSRSSPMPAADTQREANDFQDRNCSDFDSWEEAQGFFLAEGGPSKDPHRLDGDGDGDACQSLPGYPG